MTEPTDGIGRIREKALLTNKRLSLARFTMECGLTTSQFHAFLEGRSVPSATVLQAMTKWFWPHATYDAERNLLVAGNPGKPKPLGTVPQDNTAIIQQYGPQPRAEFKGFRAALPTGDQKPLTRPGWAATIGGWIS